MVCDPEKQLIIDGMQYTGCDESIKKSVTNGEASFVRSIINYNRNLNLSFLKNVTSMQRLENPKIKQQRNWPTYTLSGYPTTCGRSLRS